MSDRVSVISGDDIVNEVLEGEGLLIHFKSGSDDSLDGLGGGVWQYMAGARATESSSRCSADGQ